MPENMIEANLTDGSEAYSVLAAQVSGAHGVSGNVKLRLISTNHAVSVDALQPGRLIKARHNDSGVERDLTLQSVRKQVQPKGAWIARFKGINDRSQAEELFGSSLYIKENERPELPDGEFYVDQLIGMEVVTDTTKPLGKLVDVLNTPANDVYVTTSGVMVPAVSEFVISIELATQIITVKDAPGLLD
jgi:16S rRNA processing protein RimM